MFTELKLRLRAAWHVLRGRPTGFRLNMETQSGIDFIAPQSHVLIHCTSRITGVEIGGAFSLHKGEGGGVIAYNRAIGLGGDVAGSGFKYEEPPADAVWHDVPTGREWRRARP